MRTPEFQGYNCFASALGAVLVHSGIPFVSCAVDSVLDFHFQPSAQPSSMSVGVFPGTIHPGILAAVDHLYALDVQVMEHASVDALLVAVRGQLPATIAVSNRACEHIPRRESVELTTHYVIVEDIQVDRVVIHDPFMRYRGVMSTCDLHLATEFVAFDGERVRHRAVLLSPKALAVSEADRARRCVGEFLIGRGNWPLQGADTLRGSAAMRGLRDRVKAIRELSELSDLSLFQSLRYVQYQRQCFPRYLTTIGELAPALANLLHKAGAGARAAAEVWSRAKMLAHYALEAGRIDCLGQLCAVLDLAIQKEELVAVLLERARRELSRSSLAEVGQQHGVFGAD